MLFICLSSLAELPTQAYTFLFAELHINLITTCPSGPLVTFDGQLIANKRVNVWLGEPG